MQFVIHEKFNYCGRRFQILTGMVFLPDVEPFEKQVGNSVEFIELIQEKDLGEPLWKQTGEPIIKTKKYLYSLIEKGELTLL